MRRGWAIGLFLVAACGRTGLEAPPPELPEPPSCTRPPLPERPLCDVDGWCAALGNPASMHPTAIAGSGPDDVWIVASEGVVRWTGRRWVQHAPPVGTPTAVFVRGPDDVWVGGTGLLLRGGAMAHWDGTEWRQLPTPAGGAVQGLAAAGDTLWAAVGRALWRYDGAEWSFVDALPGANLDAVFAAADDDVWALGTQADGHSAALVHFDGRRWVELGAPVGAGPLLGAWGTGSTDIWFYGRGTLLHWDGARMSIAADRWMITAMWGDATNDVWALRDGIDARARLLHFDGSSWTEVEDAPTIATRGVQATSVLWGSGRCDLWVGGSGEPVHLVAPTLHRFDGRSWQEMSPSIPMRDSIETVVSDASGVNAFGTHSWWTGDATGWSRHDLFPLEVVRAVAVPGGFWGCYETELLRGDGTNLLEMSLPSPCKSVWSDGSDAWVALENGTIVRTRQGRLDRVPEPLPLSRPGAIFGDSPSHLFVGGVNQNGFALGRRDAGLGPLGTEGWETIPVPEEVLRGVSFGPLETWISTRNRVYRRGGPEAWVAEDALPVASVLGGTSAKHVWVAGNGVWVGGVDRTWERVSALSGVNAVAPCGEEPGWIVSGGILWERAPKD